MTQTFKAKLCCFVTFLGKMAQSQRSSQLFVAAAKKKKKNHISNYCKYDIYTFENKLNSRIAEIISEYKSERVKKSGGGLGGNNLLFALGEESENWYRSLNLCSTKLLLKVCF